MRFVPLCLALAVAGCSLLPGDYGDYGDLDANVRGALSARLHGTAALYDDQGPDGTRVELYLDITNDFADHIHIAVADGTVLTVGTYSLADGSLTEAQYDVDNRTERVFAARSASLRIERIDDDGDLHGRFDLDALDGDGQRAEITGTFRARDRRGR